MNLFDPKKTPKLFTIKSDVMFIMLKPLVDTFKLICAQPKNKEKNITKETR